MRTHGNKSAFADAFLRFPYESLPRALRYSLVSCAPTVSAPSHPRKWLWGQELELLTPGVYFRMVPCSQYCRNFIFLLFIGNGFGAGVDSRGGDAAFLHRSIFAEHARKTAGDGVADSERWHFPACVHRLADGEFFHRGERLQDFLCAFVDALVAAADEYDI